MTSSGGTSEVPKPSPLAPTSPVSVRKVNLSRVDAATWDANVIRAGGSYRSAYAHLRTIKLRYLFRARAETFQVHLNRDGEVVQIGHYTVLVSGRFRLFFDGINLYPEYAEHWSDAMVAALTQAGPGEYDYGWTWRTEPAREDLLRTIPGVEIQSVRPILIQGVDFASWPDWDSYYRSVSTNVRYDARRAENTEPDLHVEVTTGLAALLKVPKLVSLQISLYRRKGISFAAGRVFVGYVFNILLCPAQAMIASAVAAGRVLAMHKDVAFGDCHYHVNAAAAAGIAGEARYLQLAMLRRAYDATPRGKFLLGYSDVPLDEQSAKGLLQSRRFLRASGWPTSLVCFRWSGMAA